MLPFYLQSGAQKDAFMRQGGIMHNPALLFGFYALAGLMALHMSWYIYRAWQLKAPDNNGTPNQEQWHRKLLYLFAGYIGLFCAFHVMEILIGHQAMWLCYLLKFLMAVSMYGIGLVSFRKPALFSPNLRQLKSNVKYQRSTLSPTEGEKVATRLKTCLEEDQLFLDPDLTLNQLAQQIGCTPHILSQVINEQLGTTFSDLLNRLRITEAQNRLANPATADDIILKTALEVGFNNKASFNAAFKKITGTTPSAYKKAALTNSPLEATKDIF